MDARAWGREGPEGPAVQGGLGAAVWKTGPGLALGQSSWTGIGRQGISSRGRWQRGVARTGA